MPLSFFSPTCQDCLRACIYLPLCFKNVYAYNYEDVYVQLASYIPLINYMSSRDKKTRIQLEGMVVAQRTLIIIVLFSFSTTICTLLSKIKDINLWT